MSPPAVSRPARLALGLVVHDRPERTRELIDAVHSDEITVFLHVAANSAFAVEAFLPDDATRVVVVEPRSTIRWGSPRLIDAIAATMRLAATHQPDYFSLISGACWPTKPPAEIVQRLYGSSAAGFVDLAALNPGWWPRLDQFHISVPLPLPIVHNLTRVRIRLPGRHRSRIPKPYGGSCWLDLRGDVLAWLVDRIDADPAYRRHFAFTQLTDEIFFHTLLMDSPYRDQLVNIHDDEHHLLGLRYIRWTTGEHPQTLTPADLDAAQQSDCIFARKRP